MCQATIYLSHGPQILLTPITPPKNIFLNLASYQTHLDKIFQLVKKSVPTMKTNYIYDSINTITRYRYK